MDSIRMKSLLETADRIANRSDIRNCEYSGVLDSHFKSVMCTWQMEWVWGGSSGLKSRYKSAMSM